MPVNLVLVAEGEMRKSVRHTFHNLSGDRKYWPRWKKCDGVFMPSATQDLDGIVTVNLGLERRDRARVGVERAKNGDAVRRKTFTPRSKRWWTVPRGICDVKSTHHACIRGW